MLSYLKNVQASSNGANAPLRAFRTFLHRILPTFGRRVVFGGALEQLANLPLTAQSSLALVRLHDETLLLGITPQSITLLSKNREAQAGSGPSRGDVPAPQPGQSPMEHGDR